LTHAIRAAPKSITPTDPLAAADQFMAFSAADTTSGFEFLVSGAANFSVSWGDQVGAGHANAGWLLATRPVAALQAMPRIFSLDPVSQIALVGTSTVEPVLVRAPHSSILRLGQMPTLDQLAVRRIS